MPPDLSKLAPTHLIPEDATSADLKAHAAETLAAVKVTTEDDLAAKRREKVYTFAFSFQDGNGKAWEGTFTNTVPDMRTRASIGVMRAQLTGGLDYDSLDPLTRELAMILAHVTFTLAEKGRPAWAKDLLTLHNPQLLRALWAEVTAHESTFLGL